MTTEDFAATLDRMVDRGGLAGVGRAVEHRQHAAGDLLIAVDLLVQHGSRTLDDDSLGTTGADLVHELVSERFADLAAVYPSRAAFSSALPPHVLFDGARDVSIAGLSLNLICQQYPDRQLERLIEGGCTMRCLFLVP
jgi:hypothetical protein